MGKRKGKKKGGQRPKQRTFVAGSVPTGRVPTGGVQLGSAAPTVSEPAAEPALEQAQAAAAPSTLRPGQRAVVGGDQALVRSVEMSLSPAQRQVRRGGRMVIEGGDPAIPLANVPYFTRDLVRLAMVGGAMVVLLLVAAFLLVPRLA